MRRSRPAQSFGAIDEAGWLAGAQRRPSPNCDERPEGESVTLVVVHAISLPPCEFGGPWIEDLFLNRLDPGAHPYFAEIHQMRVSAHFLIRREGTLMQFVATARRAWHAGVSSWSGRSRCNDFSVGIELEGCDRLGFEPVQYEVLSDLCIALKARYPIADIVGHEDIAPGRKTDPGPFFDWPRLARRLARSRT
jgi:AmpD protein